MSPMYIRGLLLYYYQIKMSSYPSWFTDHASIMVKLNEVLNAIDTCSQIHSRFTSVTLSRRKSLRYTALLLRQIIRILLRIARTSIDPPVSDEASLDEARFRMAQVWHTITVDPNFPSACLEMNSIFGVPNFIVNSLVASGLHVHEVRVIIFVVVGLFQFHGEPISPSLVCDRLLRRVRRMF